MAIADELAAIPGKNGDLEPALKYLETAEVPEPDFTFTDRGNGARFAALFRGRVLYCPERKMWSFYDGRRWQWDTGGIKVMGLAKEVPKAIYQEAAREPDDNRRKALADHARKTENDQRLKAILSQAQSERGISVSIGKLDSNDFLLNVANGTLDLKTGTLMQHDPKDFITAYTPVEYHPDARSELWEKTLSEILPDISVRDYVQRALGYSCGGNQAEQVVFFLYGQGGNGKTTVLGAVTDTLGPDYATEIEPQVFMVSKIQGSAGPNEGIAKLYRKRLALSTEVEDGQRLSVGLIKRMSGGEKLHHEKKYEHGFEFTPTHKLWLSGNHKPTITDTTLSIWRRVKSINFTVTIPEERRDKNRRDALLAKEHQEAILAWLVKGWLDWKKHGLGEPPEVTAATELYREEMDLLADFIAERCVIQASATITVSELYKRYKDWADQNDTTALGKIRFGTRITEKGIGKGRGNYNKPIWRGIRLLEEGEKPQKVTNQAQNVTSVTGSSDEAPIAQFSLKDRGKQVTKVTEVTALTDDDDLCLAYTGLTKQELIDLWRSQGCPAIPTVQGQSASDLLKFLTLELNEEYWAALAKWAESNKDGENHGDL